MAQSTEINTAERLKYFSVIDQLRELGINEDLPLPQIVVIGDQSSGKSSLLEGLINLPFPVASDLCTRFATQLVLRRAPEEEAKVEAYIIPGNSSLDNENEKKRLLEFSFKFKKDQFTQKEFANLLAEAAECMGLANLEAADDEHLGKRFSDAILKIELSGPGESHLSVVDVPGLFHNPTRYQTKEDLQLIRKLIEDYTARSRTIILAVMDARNNLANQEVFKLARSADPEGKRTVGIITKCDALQKGDESGVMKIAENRVEVLTHGWFVVRNRSTREIQDGVTIEQRHKIEMEFFKTAPWNNLVKSRVGIAALKPFLGHLLYEHIRREFPPLLKEIKKLCHNASEQEKELGPPRRTALQQRQYLISLATKYQQNVSNVFDGMNNANAGLGSPRKLRTYLRNHEDEFHKKMKSKGHTKPFQQDDGSSSDSDEESEDDDQRICSWIRRIYLDSRGCELPGTVTPAMMEVVFRQQSINWEPISKRYVSDAMTSTKAYIEAECEALGTDESTRVAILSHLENNYLLATSRAEQQLQKLLEGERGGVLHTLDQQYADILNKIRTKRIVGRLKKMGLKDGIACTLNLKMLADAVHLSNEEQAVNDIHDVLKAYYRVALKRFVDNVAFSVVERELLGPDSPLRSFSPGYVGTMSDEELARMAGETDETSMARDEIANKVERYSKALKIAMSV